MSDIKEVFIEQTHPCQPNYPYNKGDERSKHKKNYEQDQKDLVVGFLLKPIAEHANQSRFHN